MRNFPLDVIYSSDLIRAKNTAKEIQKRRKQAIFYTSVLREIPDEIVDRRRSEWNAPKKNKQWIEHIKNFLTELDEKHNHQTVLLAGHSKTNTLITSILLGLDPHKLLFFVQSHCNITILEYGKKYSKLFGELPGWKVLLWNDMHHMPKKLRTEENQR